MHCQQNVLYRHSISVTGTPHLHRKVEPYAGNKYATLQHSKSVDSCWSTFYKQSNNTFDECIGLSAAYAGKSEPISHRTTSGVCITL